MGFFLSHTSKLNILDIIGGHFADEVITAVNGGKNIQDTGDNWDLKLQAHYMLSTNKTLISTTLHQILLLSEYLLGTCQVSPQLGLLSL